MTNTFSKLFKDVGGITEKGKAMNKGQIKHLLSKSSLADLFAKLLSIIMSGKTINSTFALKKSGESSSGKTIVIAYPAKTSIGFQPNSAEFVLINRIF